MTLIKNSAVFGALCGAAPALSLLLMFALPSAHAQMAIDQTALAQTPATSASIEPYRPEQEYDEYMRLGFASYQSGEYADAANFFRYALYAVPRDREATVAYWNAVNELQSPNQDLTGRAAIYEANMEAGYDATEVSDYDAAMVYFRTALQQRPNDYYATQAIRNVHTYLNRGVNADSPSDIPLTYNVYAEETPYDRYMRLGYAAVQREDLAASITYFRSALYERKNDRQATIAYWNAVDGLRDGEFGLDTNPESVFDRYMRLGYDATTRNDYAQAVSFFERALAERPGDGYATQAIRNVRSYTE